MIGLYTATLLWLNKGQILTFGLALILAVGLILVEIIDQAQKAGVNGIQKRKKVIRSLPER